MADYNPSTLEQNTRDILLFALNSAREKVNDPVSKIKIDQHKANTIDKVICQQTADKLITLSDEQNSLYAKSATYSPYNKNVNPKLAPCYIITNGWKGLVREACSQLDRDSLFLLASQILINDKHRSKLFNDMLAVLRETAIYFRHTALHKSVEFSLSVWKQTPHIEDKFTDEIGQTVFEYKQPNEEKTGYIKNLKIKFDSLRYLRILSRMTEMEKLLEVEEKNLKLMPVQSDAEDIHEERRKFVGNKEMFLKHFHNHRIKLANYRENLEKYLKYQQDAGLHGADSIRYFHALYVDSKAIVDAYTRFDQRVDRQIAKIEGKINSSGVLDSSDEEPIVYPAPTPILQSDLNIQPKLPENPTPLAMIIAKREQQEKINQKSQQKSHKSMLPPPMPPAGLNFNQELSKMHSPRSPDRGRRSNDDSRTVVRSSPPRSPERATNNTSQLPKNRYTDSANPTSQSTGSKRRWSAESVMPEAPPVIRGRVVENLRRDAYNSLKEGEDEETLVTGKVYVKEAKKSKWKSLKPIVDTKPRARSRSPTYRKRDYNRYEKPRDDRNRNYDRSQNPTSDRSYNAERSYDRDSRSDRNRQPRFRSKFSPERNRQKFVAKSRNKSFDSDRTASDYGPDEDKDDVKDKNVPIVKTDFVLDKRVKSRSGNTTDDSMSSAPPSLPADPMDKLETGSKTDDSSFLSSDSDSDSDSSSESPARKSMIFGGSEPQKIMPSIPTIKASPVSQKPIPFAMLPIPGPKGFSFNSPKAQSPSISRSSLSPVRPGLKMPMPNTYDKQSAFSTPPRPTSNGGAPNVTLLHSPTAPVNRTLKNISKLNNNSSDENKKAFFLRGINNTCSNKDVMVSLAAYDVKVVKLHLPQETSVPGSKPYNKGYAFVHVEDEQQAYKMLGLGELRMTMASTGTVDICKVLPYTESGSIHRAKSPMRSAAAQGGNIPGGSSRSFSPVRNSMSSLNFQGSPKFQKNSQNPFQSVKNDNTGGLMLPRDPVSGNKVAVSTVPLPPSKIMLPPKMDMPQINSIVNSISNSRSLPPPLPPSTMPSGLPPVPNVPKPPMPPMPQLSQARHSQIMNPNTFPGVPRPPMPPIPGGGGFPNSGFNNSSFSNSGFQNSGFNAKLPLLPQPGGGHPATPAPLPPMNLQPTVQNNSTTLQENLRNILQNDLLNDIQNDLLNPKNSFHSPPVPPMPSTSNHSQNSNYVPVIRTVGADFKTDVIFEKDTSYQLPRASTIQYDKMEETSILTSISSSDSAKKVKFKTVNFNGSNLGQGKLNVAAAFQEDFDEGMAKKRTQLDMKSTAFGLITKQINDNKC